MEEEKKQNNFQAKKFLFVSLESLSGDLTWYLKKEGHEVKVYIKNAADRDVYDGFIEKVDNWENYKDWADVIVFDDVGFGEVADSLRKEGRLVIGGSRYTDRLEEDREFGQDEVGKAGMNTLPHFNFADFDSAIKFLKENPGRYVFKPSGFVHSPEKELLFISQEEDGKDLLEVLEHNKRSWSKKITSFQLQKFAAGVEIAVGAFFNGSDFIYPINVNFEHKRLFPGEIGPFTGEMGTLMFWTPPNTVFNNTLLKMKDKLAEANYVGYIDINCIANARGIYPIEFTSRFGYPTISIQIEGIQTPIGEFLFKLANKEKFELKVKRGFQIGVVVAVPPFPFDDKTISNTYKDSTILFKKDSLEGIHLGDVKLVDGDWHLAGESGYALVITGSGSTVDEARKQCYNRIKNVMLQ
ncbi:MAG: phosphoribosylamine--glycine ligase, partial [Candidatus Hydrothermarchaeota archaeon]|nr:phosphoribosylamine--glycine ligase [Candidatus Hydrothermarchaeota archaeon]